MGQQRGALNEVTTPHGPHPCITPSKATISRVGKAIARRNRSPIPNFRVGSTNLVSKIEAPNHFFFVVQRVQFPLAPNLDNAECYIARGLQCDGQMPTMRSLAAMRFGER